MPKAGMGRSSAGEWIKKLKFPLYSQAIIGGDKVVRFVRFSCGIMVAWNTIRGVGKISKIYGNSLMYKSVEDLQEKIDEYFLECEGTPYYNNDGTPLATEKGAIVYRIPPHPPTVTGLALALGFSSRQALINYQRRPAYNYAIMRAKLRIEAYAEERLFDRDGVKGAQFSLACNYGWGRENNGPAQNEESGVVLLPEVGIDEQCEEE